MKDEAQQPKHSFNLLPKFKQEVKLNIKNAVPMTKDDLLLRNGKIILPNGSLPGTAERWRKQFDIPDNVDIIENPDFYKDGNTWRRKGT